MKKRSRKKKARADKVFVYPKKKVRVIRVNAIDRLQSTANDVWTWWCVRFNATDPENTKRTKAEYDKAVARLSALATKLKDALSTVEIEINL